MTSTAPDSANFFIALVPPPALQAEITAIKTDIWQRFHSQAALRSPPHITLHPPFTWPLDSLATVEAVLASFAQAQVAIPIGLSGYKAFPPRVIYINVVPETRLDRGQAALQTTLADTLGLGDRQAHRYPFTPHVTVGFRDLTPAAFRRAWADYKDRPFQAHFVAHYLTLLRHDGHRWQIAADFPLLGEPLAPPP